MLTSDSDKLVRHKVAAVEPQVTFLAPFPTCCAGNLGRFLNHSCSPNLMKQPVLIPGDSGLRYRMCFFAYG